MKTLNKGVYDIGEKTLSHQDFLAKYPLLRDKNHVLVGKSAPEIFNAAEKEESFVLYLGFDSCPWCQTLSPILNEAAKKLKISAIWYWDLKPFRGDGAQREHREEYLGILSLIGFEPPPRRRAKLTKGISGVSRVSTPLVALIKDGKILSPLKIDLHIGRARLMYDAEGRASSDPKFIRYQDAWSINSKGEVLATYMWDDLITGQQVPTKYHSIGEWLQQRKFTEPLQQNLATLLQHF